MSKKSSTFAPDFVTENRCRDGGIGRHEGLWQDIFLFMRKRKWTDQDFVEAVRTSYSYAQVIEKLHLRVAGSNYDTVKRKIQELQR